MIKRSRWNPLIKPSDVKPSYPDYEVVGAFNPAAAIYNNEVILLVRVAECCKQIEGKVRVPIYDFTDGAAKPAVKEFDLNDPDVQLKDTRGVVYKGNDFLSSISHLRIARSSDGENFTVDDKPFIAPDSAENEYGVEDPRITFIDNRYYINYTIVSKDSWCTALSVTDDFISYEYLGIIFHPENKDVAIFPEKVNEKYLAFHRPNNSGFGKASIWFAESPDLIHWGKHRCMIRPRDMFWEGGKIGGGCAPIRTEKGWLTIYHAKAEDSQYSLFGLLLDLKEPWKVIGRTEKPILLPREKYEKHGFFSNAVFTNGMVEIGGRLLIYYGAADDTCCVAVTTVNDLLNSF